MANLYNYTHNLQPNDVYMPPLNINSDFQVNQRGESEYNPSKAGTYTLDTWYTRQGNYANAIKISQVANGMKVVLPSTAISAGLRQRTYCDNSWIGKKARFLISINDVEYDKIMNITTEDTGIMITNDISFSCSYDNTNMCIEIRFFFSNTSDNDITNVPFIINYCAIYPSTYTGQHHKEDYASALMRCQRYIVVYSGNRNQFAFGKSYPDKVIKGIFNLPVPMDRIPTVQIVGGICLDAISNIFKVQSAQLIQNICIVNFTGSATNVPENHIQTISFMENAKLIFSCE